MAIATQRELLIQITAGSVEVEGMLHMPENATGVILFAHGSGSSRFSPRNNFVAEKLREVHLGTLLMDLLTPDEERTYQTRFNISLLSSRLNAAVEWLLHAEATRLLSCGLFGASTGAAAALQVAAERGAQIGAVVSRGGRPDLAGRQALAKVLAPTLLIVGGLDDVVIELNQMAYSALHGERRLEIVPGATHLFEEPGKLEQVAKLAADWFARHLTSPGLAG
ncbi:MAG: dienelactone hydrolase family protein [Burkholderiales bacterium]|nr:dienelactone hydrolase family protein [Burkholderiales bacterium]